MFTFTSQYTKEVEIIMVANYNNLSEKDARIYAWSEAIKLGRWWVSYIKKLFKCGVNTVKTGIKEIQEVANWNNKREWRVRLPWWWRSEIIKKHPEILQDFDEVVKAHTAGSPTNPNLKWTNMKPPKIAKKMNELKRWYEISVYVVKQIMIIKGMWLRRISKTKTFKSVLSRDEQFVNIKEKVDEFNKAWKPVLSTDVKKKKIPDC